jgi:hypothetical protein
VKKLIINIGQESVVGATYETSGKSQTINRVFEFPCLHYYNNHGMLDFIKIVAAIKKTMPKDCRHLDIELILPTHVTDVEYIDAVGGVSQDDKPAHNTTVKTVYIGENQTKKINQKITYNNKVLKGIVDAFYKAKLNVVRAVSNVSCYHNFMAVFNNDDVFSGNEHKTHICMVWGVSKIYYIIMVGNLPVEIRVSDTKLTDLYRDIATMGGDLPLYQILNVIDSFILSVNPEEGIVLQHVSNQFFDGEKNITLPDSVIGIIKSRFFTFITDMIREVRTIYDYVGHKYNSGSVFVCTNSKLLDECICKTLSDTFPIEYLQATGLVEVYGNKFNIRSMTEFTDKYNPILGYVIESIKKGGDFYDA